MRTQKSGGKFGQKSRGKVLAEIKFGQKGRRKISAEIENPSNYRNGRT